MFHWKVRMGKVSEFSGYHSVSYGNPLIRSLERAEKDKGKQEVITAGKERFIHNPEQPYRKFLIGTPTLGVVRMEWSSARRSLIIPINWGAGEFIASHLPESVVAQGYTVADAENIILDQFIKGDYEWLLFLEDDNLPPADSLIKMEVHVLKARSPVISSIYFSKGSPSWPLVFRGRGNGCFLNFNMGDLVWADGVPLGFTLLHKSVLKWLWDHSPEYTLPGGTKVKKVFEFPRSAWYDPELDRYFTNMGTSDLKLCDRIMQEDVLSKTGWSDLAKKKYPFLCDSSIFVRHVDLQGKIFPDCAEKVIWPRRQKRGRENDFHIPFSL